MEHFFTPARPAMDMYEFIPWGYSEVHLAVPIEAFLKHRWDWSDFRAFFAGDSGQRGTILWIAWDTLCWIESENTADEYAQHGDFDLQRAVFMAPSGETYVLVLAKDVGSAFLSSGASSLFWHAVTTSNCVKLKLRLYYSSGILSGPAISQFLEASPGLELLEFESFTFEEAHCRALAAVERTDLEVTFDQCQFDAQGAEDIFIAWLRHSRVVRNHENCSMENSIISALSGNSSVKSLSVDTAFYGCGNDAIRSFATVLPYNQGIEKLHIMSMLSDETWSFLLRSLWAHPRIQSVTISEPFSDASKTSMMNAILQLAQRNKGVYTIDLPDHKDEDFYHNSILPRLEMNRTFEDQRQALIRADPAIRGQLLGRALHVVRNNPDVSFRFLSENVPLFVRSDEDGPILPTGRKRKGVRS
jgi:hypothetical protein